VLPDLRLVGDRDEMKATKKGKKPGALATSSFTTRTTESAVFGGGLYRPRVRLVRRRHERTPRGRPRDRRRAPGARLRARVGRRHRQRILLPDRLAPPPAEAQRRASLSRARPAEVRASTRLPRRTAGPFARAARFSSSCAPLAGPVSTTSTCGLDRQNPVAVARRRHLPVQPRGAASSLRHGRRGGTRRSAAGVREVREDVAHRRPGAPV